MKFLKILLLSLLVLIPNGLLAFNDSLSFGSYSTAINFLRTKNIVQGYPDGTFKPGNSINRAELTKILLESNNVQVVEPSAKCFKDVELNEWYAKYVCTAKSLGWIEGYPDGTFKPANFINRVESLKIISYAEGWAVIKPTLTPFSDALLSEWYVSHVYYAKNKNYLPFQNLLEPAKNITRGEFAEIYYRVLYTEENRLNQFDLSLIENIVPNVEYYSRNVFSGIYLDNEFPRKIIKDEVISFKGKVVGNSKTVNLALLDQFNNKIYSTKVDLSQDNTFNIPYRFNGIGSYSISLSVDGQVSQLAKVEVINYILNDQLALDVEDDDFSQSLTFNGKTTNLIITKDSDLVRVNFIQDKQKVTYYHRFDNQPLTLIYSDFEKFVEGDVLVSLEAADFLSNNTTTGFKLVSEKEYEIGNHYKSELTNEIYDVSVPDFHNGQIKISGFANVSLSPNLYLMEPNSSNIQKYEIEKNTILKDQKFNLDFSVPKNKIFIIELNNINGVAVLNHPVYPAGLVPLIPDYFDLNPITLSTKNITESDEVNLLFDLVNTARENFNLPNVNLKSDLSDLAELHAKDMIDKNYFSHNDLKGNNPQQRALNKNLRYIVSENIAKVPNTQYGFEALMRSAIHRQNILNPDWTDVGLAVKKNLQGYYYIVQEFGITRKDFQKKLKNILMLEYKLLLENSALTDRAKDWSAKIVEEDIFSTNINGENIFDGLSSSIGVSAVQAIILTGSTQTEVLNLIQKNSNLSTNSAYNFGMGVDYDKNGLPVVVFIWGN